MTRFEQTKMFLKICIKYEAPLEPLISVNQVNQWYTEKTHGKITNILYDLHPNTVILLLIAIYFKTDWQHKFNPDDTYKIDELLKYTDLVLLDIKHINDDEHKKLTKHSNINILLFAKYLSNKNIPIWIRHVVVPGINDKEEYLKELGKFMGCLTNIRALDVLPYHNMAISKYENLKIDYPLKDTPPLSKEDAIKARNIILQAYKQAKRG